MWSVLHTLIVLMEDELTRARRYAMRSISEQIQSAGLSIACDPAASGTTPFASVLTLLG